MDPLTLLRPDWQNLEMYTPIKPLEVLADEIGLPVEKLIKLDANENLYGPIPEVKEAVNRSNLHIYPDPSQMYLRTSLAKYTNLPVECLIGGCGSDDIIDIAMRLVDPHTVLICTPTFGMYSFLGKINKCKILDVPRLPLTFQVDFEAVEKAVKGLPCPPNRVVMFFPSPNNPTGNALNVDQVERLCALGATVLIDEAYAEFCEDSWVSALTLVPRIPNLIVLRTFSKWAALAGLRVGYGAAQPKIIEWMMAIKQPYNVSAAADVAARAALEHIDKVLVTVNAIKLEKGTMLDKLQRFSRWLTACPSLSNFVLFRVRAPINASQVATLLRKHGVLVRFFNTGILRDYVRISVGRPSDTDRLVEVLLTIQHSWDTIWDTYVPQALIFDMDGVIADVSLSYRQSIIDTAQFFAATVTHQDINEAKAAGNANNDWILTHRLVSAYHSRVGAAANAVTIPSLEEVTSKFEDIYQGSGGRPGLRESEKLLITLDEFTRFKLHVPLAIVTGRPRSDAVKFLQLHNLDHLFHNLVCMEDAPAKPSPEPVRLAIQRIGGGGGITRALMIGDTPDDIRAAVSAGIVGIGILSPGDRRSPDSAKIRAALELAGAAKVVESANELLAVCARAVPAAASFEK